MRRETELLFIQELKCEIMKLMLVDPVKAKYIEYLLHEILEEYTKKEAENKISLKEEKAESKIHSNLLINDLITRIWLRFFSKSSTDFSNIVQETPDLPLFVSGNGHFLMLREELEAAIEQIQNDSSRVEEDELWTKFRTKMKKMTLMEQTIIIELLYRVKYEKKKQYNQANITNQEAILMMDFYCDIVYILSLKDITIEYVQKQIKAQLNSPTPDLKKILELVIENKRLLPKMKLTNQRVPVGMYSGFKLSSIKLDNKVVTKLQKKYGTITNPIISHMDGILSSYFNTTFVDDNGLIFKTIEDKFLYEMRKSGAGIGDDGQYSDPDIQSIMLLPLGIKFFYTVKDGKLLPTPTTGRRVCFDIYYNEKDYLKGYAYEKSIKVDYDENGQMRITVETRSDIDGRYYIYIDNGKLHIEIHTHAGSIIYKQRELIKEPINDGYRTQIIEYAIGGKINYSVVRMDKNIGEYLFEYGEAIENRGNVDQNLVFDKSDVVSSLRKGSIPPEYNHRIEYRESHYYDKYTGEELHLRNNFKTEEGSYLGAEILVALNGTYKVEYINGEAQYYIDDTRVTSDIYYSCRKARTKPLFLDMSTQSVSVKSIA